VYIIVAGCKKTIKRHGSKSRYTGGTYIRSGTHNIYVYTLKATEEIRQYVQSTLGKYDLWQMWVTEILQQCVFLIYQNVVVYFISNRVFLKAI
jgi:hypothetical protein